MNKHHHKAIWIMIAIHQLMGFIWYSPAFFLSPWLAGQGKTVEQTNMKDPFPFIWDIATTILAAYTLSWLTNKLAAHTFVKGTWVGMLVFFGIILQAIAPHYKFLGMPDTVLFIDLGFPFLWTIVTTGVLAAWRKKDKEQIV